VDLLKWSGFHPATLRRIDYGKLTVNGFPTTLLAADIWLYFNKPGTREPNLERHFRLPLDEGIGVIPTGKLSNWNPAFDFSARRKLVSGDRIFPRLALLGIRAFVPSRLLMLLDTGRERLSLYTRWSWLFG